MESDYPKSFVAISNCVGLGNRRRVGDASAAEIREALGSGCPNHPLHKIACGPILGSGVPSSARVKQPNARYRRAFIAQSAY
jgi:hypothetical protein